MFCCKKGKSAAYTDIHTATDRKTGNGVQIKICKKLPLMIVHKRFHNISILLCCLLQCFFFVSSFKYVVHRNLMKIGQFYQYFSRYIQFSSFIVAVHSLAAGQYNSHFSLSQIPVFSQIPDTVHPCNHPFHGSSSKLN